MKSPETFRPPVGVFNRNDVADQSEGNRHDRGCEHARNGAVKRQVQKAKPQTTESRSPVKKIIEEVMTCLFP